MVKDIGLATSTFMGEEDSTWAPVLTTYISGLNASRQPRDTPPTPRGELVALMGWAQEMWSADSGGRGSGSVAMESSMETWKVKEYTWDLEGGGGEEAKVSSGGSGVVSHCK